MSERLKRSDLPAQCYDTFNIGNLCGVMHEERENGELLPSSADLAIAEAIGAVSSEHGIPNVKCLDLGGGLGLGLHAVQAVLAKGVNPRTDFTVTNREVYDPTKSLKTLETIRDYKERFPDNADSVVGLHFWYPNKSELELARVSLKNVRYIHSFDTVDLPNLQRWVAPDGFHIIHEYFGGLEHHDAQEKAMETVMKSLHKKVGMLITGFESLLYWKDLKYWESQGVTVYGAYPEHMFMSPSRICVLAFPDAPIPSLKNHFSFFDKIDTDKYSWATGGNQERV